VIAGWCTTCGSPAHVEYMGALYCYECGKRAIKQALESAIARGNAAEAVDRADSEERER
jgi:uncharacterized Zn finger protein (UPF0148 family)